MSEIILVLLQHKYLSMTDSINIRNCEDRIYFSEITHDMFCDHRIPTRGVMMVRSGILTIETEDEHIEAHSGEYIFWNRNCKSRMKKSSDGDIPFRSIAISLDSNTLRSFFSENLSNKRLPVKIMPIYSPAVPLPHNIKLDSLFMSLMPYADQGIDPDRETINAALQSAIQCLLSIDDRMYPTLFDFHETWKIDLLDFMEKHFAEKMTIEEYASYTGRSLATFKRDFAKISPLTPQKWLIEQRLELSAKLLKDSKIKPSTVYYEVGFRNRTHFSGLFKQRYGLSPAAYQRQTINHSN